MQTSKTSPAFVLPHLTVSKAWLADRLGLRIEQGESIALRRASSVEQYRERLKDAEAWSGVNYELLHRAFADSTVAGAYERTTRMRRDDVQHNLSDDEPLTVRVRDAIRFLRTVGERLELHPDDRVAQDDEAADPSRPPSLSRKVFVVHGHDAAAKESLARFLAQLDLEPVILHEQPSAGSTIIEKLERHGDVGCAVVLLTPDDTGNPVGEPERSSLRARQNVIFELGYFLARLGRSRVFALHVDDVEIPSDYHGVIYIQMDDSGAWRLTLARDIKSAGVDVDMNRAL